MKILIICDRLDLAAGGLEKAVISQINGLLELGHEVMLNVNAMCDENLSTIKKENFHLTCPWSLPWNNVVNDLNGFIPDVVHAHPFSAIDRGLIVSQKYNTPFFVTIHGPYSFGLGQYCTKIFCVDHVAESVVKTNCDHSKIQVLYNGVDVDKFSYNAPSKEFKESLGLKNYGKILLVATRYQDNKEVPVKQLIEVLPDLAKRLLGLNVIFVGEGMFLDEIKEKSLKYQNEYLNTVFCGSVNNIQDYFNISDLVLASARTAIEAVLCDCNVFQMGIGYFGESITKYNYKETLYHTTKYKHYTNVGLTDELFNLLDNYYAPLSFVLSGIIREECDIKNIINTLEQCYKDGLNG
jgi:glycosyltransferase involved in cell wall biosynthesis